MAVLRTDTGLEPGWRAVVVGMQNYLKNFREIDD